MDPEVDGVTQCWQELARFAMIVFLHVQSWTWERQGNDPNGFHAQIYPLHTLMHRVFVHYALQDHMQMHILAWAHCISLLGLGSK